jgi:hypothetical protein
MEYKIQNKPIPKRNGSHKARLDYPIDKLVAGSDDSFTVPCTPDKVKKVSASIRAFAYRNNFNVLLRQGDEGVDVWRNLDNNN